MSCSPPKDGGQDSDVLWGFLKAELGGNPTTAKLHAAFLVLVGRFTPSVHRAYTLFYVIGTLGAIRVPPVGYGPLKSMEQLGAFASAEHEGQRA